MGGALGTNAKLRASRAGYGVVVWTGEHCQVDGKRERGGLAVLTSRYNGSMSIRPASIFLCHHFDVILAALTVSPCGNHGESNQHLTFL